MLTPLSWLLPQEQKADVKDDAMIDLILVLFGSHAHKAKASHLISAAHLTHFRFGNSIQNRF